MNALRLYARYISISLQGQMQYKLSFVMQSLSLFLVTGSEFLALVFLFQRFGALQGWSLPEVAFLYGLVNCGFAISEAFARGFDVFDQMLKRGDFDRVLLRPRSAAFQILAQDFQLMRIGHLLQGSLVLGWSMYSLDIHWTLATLALVLWTIIGGVCLFSGLFVVQATAAFFTVEGLELLNIFTYGGVEASQYPLSIYKPGFRLFFTFVVPLACVGYLPGLVVLGRSAPSWLAVLSPIAGVAFLALCLQIFAMAARRYTSTGS